MIIHDASNFGAILPFVVAMVAFLIFLGSLAQLASGEFVLSLKWCGLSAACIVAYIGLVIVVSLASPQTVVNIGDSYCADIWCIGIDKVTATPRGNEMVYKLDVRIFSDAKRVHTSAKGASLFLFDEMGRRFGLEADPSAIPFDLTLKPHESVKTTLTFGVSPDSRELNLWGDAGKAPFWTRLYLGSDGSLFHKPTLLRVL